MRNVAARTLGAGALALVALTGCTATEPEPDLTACHDALDYADELIDIAAVQAENSSVVMGVAKETIEALITPGDGSLIIEQGIDTMLDVHERSQANLRRLESTMPLYMDSADECRERG